MIYVLYRFNLNLLNFCSFSKFFGEIWGIETEFDVIWVTEYRLKSFNVEIWLRELCFDLTWPDLKVLCGNKFRSMVHGVFG